MPDLLHRHWVFDLDGTLTVAVHDFAALKRDLGLPEDLAVLEGIAAAPEAARPDLLARVADWEWRHAGDARRAPHAAELLRRVPRPVGIVTRNRRDVALRTLQATGLLECFDPADVLGRDEARPKPAPDGILALLGRWGIAPGDAVFIGDHGLDVVAGRAAGVWSIHLTTGPPHPEADQAVACLSELLTGAV